MEHKERVLEVIAHNDVDRVPVDYWATPSVNKRLMEYLGVFEQEELLQMLGVDIRYVFPPYVGPALRSFCDGSREDIWGVRRKHVKAGGAVYSEVSYSPLAEFTTIEELKVIRELLIFDILT